LGSFVFLFELFQVIQSQHCFGCFLTSILKFSATSHRVAYLFIRQLTSLTSETTVQLQSCPWQRDSYKNKFPWEWWLDGGPY